jgi:hypothetical protein
MDALLSKLFVMRILQAPRFQIYLITSLIDRFFHDSPRELFELLMKLEYSWRLSLHAPYGEENEVMMTSVVGYNEAVKAEEPVYYSSEDPAFAAKEEDHSEEVADEYYHRGWNEGRNALREEILGDDAKRAIQELIINHRLKKSASGRLVCACNRGSEDAVDWSIHVRVRIMNYLRNEFISQADARDKA